MQRPPTRLAAVLAAAAALAIAACGSGTGPSGATTGASNTPRLLLFAKCMRSEGVSGFPDPGGARASGSGVSMYGIALPPTMNVKSPAFQSAVRVCQKLITGGAAHTGVTEAQRKAALRYARCMRAPGVANFPDPVFRNGRIGIGIGAGNNPNSPVLLAAAKACGHP